MRIALHVVNVSGGPSDLKKLAVVAVTDTLSEQEHDEVQRFSGGFVQFPLTVNYADGKSQQTMGIAVPYSFGQKQCTLGLVEPEEGCAWRIASRTAVVHSKSGKEHAAEFSAREEGTEVLLVEARIHGLRGKRVLIGRVASMGYGLAMQKVKITTASVFGIPQESIRDAEVANDPVLERDGDATEELQRALDAVLK